MRMCRPVFARFRVARVVREWCTDAIDAGHNMSSMGMTLMLHILLSQWLGANASRVAQSRSGWRSWLCMSTASTSLWILSHVVQLFHAVSRVDGFCCLHRNGHTRRGHGGGGASGGTVARRRRSHGGGGSRLHDRTNGHHDQRVVISIGGHGWRRLGQNASDTDRIVRPLLLNRKRKRE